MSRVHLRLRSEERRHPRTSDSPLILTPLPGLVGVGVLTQNVGDVSRSTRSDQPSLGPTRNTQIFHNPGSGTVRVYTVLDTKGVIGSTKTTCVLPVCGPDHGVPGSFETTCDSIRGVRPPVSRESGKPLPSTGVVRVSEHTQKWEKLDPITWEQGPGPAVYVKEVCRVQKEGLLRESRSSRFGRGTV